MYNLNYGVRQLYCQNNENINITHIIPGRIHKYNGGL